MSAVICPACGHTETGESYHPHDAMTVHYATHHRALACGCQAGTGGQLWACYDHAAEYVRERTAWRIANYYTRRWATTPDPQASLFERTDR